ncbi:unnamed protein product [Rotaria sp. Silwood2]|nr:unnamed protein product [Rotaria sp. Silwood2]CAF2994610.1 unnamed protein product [Rotaria sp. Silwood2]CAF3147700.1 unnamed protein product [Rotaria sp. Silwood2]CAF4445915.1 unnamed protein product [Rotaria sp. Silwood2]CAF4498166.1 unnamed protein product [Rotaria sp. Silwood2]
MSTSILPTIQSQLNFYGYPICLVLGNIGNIFIVIIFSQQRVNACSTYLISSAIANSCYLTFNSFIQIFPFYYADESIRAFALCKIRFYVSNLLGQIAKTMITLACIDRFMFTSSRATFRAFSQPKRAKWLVFVSIIFWFIFASHIAIMTTIINKRCGTFGTYSTIYTVYSIIFVGLIPPIILSIFGYSTYSHMRQIHLRIQPIGPNNRQGNITMRQRDRELLIIVIAEVFVYVVTTTPYPLILLEMMISPYVLSKKSVQYSQIESFIFTVAFLLLFVNNTAPFYTYLTVSKSFRRDFKQLIINGYRKIRRQPTAPNISGTQHHTFTKRDTYN